VVCGVLRSPLRIEAVFRLYIDNYPSLILLDNSDQRRYLVPTFWAQYLSGSFMRRETHFPRCCTFSSFEIEFVGRGIVIQQIPKLHNHKVPRAL
jgi:hypothetical protein